MSKRNNIVFAVFLIALITFVAFLPSLKNGFTFWDDDLYVTENPLIVSLSPENLKTIFSGVQLGFYHPFTILSYAVEHRFFGLDPRVYHSTNLVLHILNCLIVFWLFLLLTRNVFASFAGAVLYAIHPLRVESVAWVSQRKDVLCAFFFLLSLVCYIYYEKSGRLRVYLLSFFAFVMSMMSKSMGITFPFLLLAVDYVTGRKFSKKALIDKIAFAAVAVFFVFISFIAQKNVGAINEGSGATLFSKILVASYGFLFYLVKTVIPAGLSCVYLYPGKVGEGMPTVLLISPIVVAAILLGVFLTVKRTRNILFGFLFYSITIFPVLQIVPVTWTVAADRYSYIPSIGIFFLAAVFLSRIDRRILAWTTVFLASAVLSFLTWDRCKVWNDNVSLWGDVLKKYPRYAIAYLNRGYGYYAKGHFDVAIADYDAAAALDPSLVEAYTNRGSVYFSKKEYVKAVSDYDRALTLNPAHPFAHNNRGNAYLAAGDYDKAIEDYNEALKVTYRHIKSYKGRAKIFNNRGFAYFKKGEYDNAISDFERAIAVNPAIAEIHNNMGNAFFEKGDYDKAVASYSRALAIDPNHAGATYNRGAAYLRKGMRENALNDFTAAAKLGFPVDPKIFDSLRRQE